MFFFFCCLLQSIFAQLTGLLHVFFGFPAVLSAKISRLFQLQPRPVQEFFSVPRCPLVCEKCIDTLLYACGHGQRPRVSINCSRRSFRLLSLNCSWDSSSSTSLSATSGSQKIASAPIICTLICSEDSSSALSSSCFLFFPPIL